MIGCTASYSTRTHTRCGTVHCACPSMAHVLYDVVLRTASSIRLDRLDRHPFLGGCPSRPQSIGQRRVAMGKGRDKRKKAKVRLGRTFSSSPTRTSARTFTLTHTRKQAQAPASERHAVRGWTDSECHAVRGCTGSIRSRSTSRTSTCMSTSAGCRSLFPWLGRLPTRTSARAATRVCASPPPSPNLSFLVLLPDNVTQT